MEKLTNDQMENLEGGQGTTRTEYCYTLWLMWENGTYQQDVIQWAAAWQPNCEGYHFSEM